MLGMKHFYFLVIMFVVMFGGFSFIGYSYYNEMSSQLAMLHSDIKTLNNEEQSLDKTMQGVSYQVYTNSNASPVQPLPPTYTCNGSSVPNLMANSGTDAVNLTCQSGGN